MFSSLFFSIFFGLDDFLFCRRMRPFFPRTLLKLSEGTASMLLLLGIEGRRNLRLVNKWRVDKDFEDRGKNNE